MVNDGDSSGVVWLTLFLEDGVFGVIAILSCSSCHGHRIDLKLSPLSSHRSL